MEDDLYGDLVTSAGDAGAGLLKEKARAHDGCSIDASHIWISSEPRRSA